MSACDPNRTCRRPRLMSAHRGEADSTRPVALGLLLMGADEVADRAQRRAVFLPLRPAKLAFAMSAADTRKIIHIDMDAFYASVEQRDDPALRGRPVAIGYAAKRGVVAAASYEARIFGVRSAMPSTTALRKCPDLVFVPPRFEIYRAVSRQIHSIFVDYTALIEPLSLDEAYLDVTENLRGISTAAATAAEIRARIFAETALTASAGSSQHVSRQA